MKIVQLQAENVKRLSAVSIKPDGSLVVVGGKNGAGKTSVLDSIMYALAGTKSIPAEPIRVGAKSGKIVVELDGERKLTVTRKLTPAGGTLEITTADGFKAPSPQAILDGLCGKVAFDPLAFTRLGPREQADALKALVGLDFTALDNERKALYDERTAVGREGKALKARAESIVVPPGTPDKEVDVAELLATLKAQQAKNAEIETFGRKVEQMARDVAKERADIRTTTSEIEEMRRSLLQAEKDLAQRQHDLEIAHTVYQQAVADLAASPPIDTSPTEKALANATAVNSAVQMAKGRALMDADLEASRAKWEALTARIDAIDAEKAAKLSETPWPVLGLGFGTDGVTLNGLPFNQASSAEQLRVSVALGLASHPHLKVLLVRDGSLLDPESLRLVGELAAQNDAQVWLERVSEGAECSVVIEDGHLKEAKTAAA